MKRIKLSVILEVTAPNRLTTYEIIEAMESNAVMYVYYDCCEKDYDINFVEILGVVRCEKETDR